MFLKAIIKGIQGVAGDHGVSVVAEIVDSIFVEFSVCLGSFD